MSGITNVVGVGASVLAGTAIGGSMLYASTRKVDRAEEARAAGPQLDYQAIWNPTYGDMTPERATAYKLAHASDAAGWTQTAAVVGSLFTAGLGASFARYGGLPRAGVVGASAFTAATLLGAAGGFALAKQND